MDPAHEDVTIPLPPEPIDDFQEKHPHLGDVVAASTVSTLHGTKFDLVTIGFHGYDEPTPPGQQTEGYRMLFCPDDKPFSPAEATHQLHLPQADQPLMKKGAERTHQLVAFAHQLIDVTPEILEQLQRLFTTAQLVDRSSLDQLETDTRATLTGELVHEAPKEALLRKLGMK
ncbi:MAG: hypothetical protein JW991_02290 [Candidatus Pacebacteria bacterium]|nr:hypothetical protein [Candidatus Paceibacterota bacterium]